MRNFLLVLSSIVFLLSSQYVCAWTELTDTVDLRCRQFSGLLDCSYRLLNAEKVLAITASDDADNPAVIDESSYPDKDAATAVLFLIDTSDPARQNVIDKNIEHIKKILGQTKQHHKLGVAVFDKELRIISPIGTSPFLITKSLSGLKAKGRTTELYRSLLTAIEHLKGVVSQRKVIFLLSDGQAEDKAYFHSDVVALARNTGVVINSIGYPRSVSLSVALQTTRRLSEETGGKYIESDSRYNIPDDGLSGVFDNIDTGGRVRIHLDRLKSGPIKLVFKTSTGSETIAVPFKIKSASVLKSNAAEAGRDTTDTVVNKPPSEKATQPIQVITRQVDTQPINLWLWYGLPAAFIIIIIFILIALFSLWYRQPTGNKRESQNDYKPYAYLLTDDGTNTRYPITRKSWRIGRGKNNELTLNDTSVSRFHAEIHRNTNGTFDIIDMNSMNGIYVNNEKIGKAILQEGDTIEIGDIALHFTQFAADYSLEESTVVQKTKLPH